MKKEQRDYYIKNYSTFRNTAHLGLCLKGVKGIMIENIKMSYTYAIIRLQLEVGVYAKSSGVY